MRDIPRGWLKVAPLLLVVGVALAAPPADEGGVQVPFSKQVNLTPEETLAQVKDYRDKMQTVLKRVMTLADQAQKQKDVIKLNCVNDKLIQVRGHLAVGDKAYASLQDAIKQSDAGSRQHEYTRITILHNKVTVLGTEAENCIGEDITYFGDQRVVVEVDPSIPEGDPTIVPVPTLEPVPRPSEASPSDN